MELFARKGEKGLLKSMFGGDSSDSADSSDEEVALQQTSGLVTKSESSGDGVDNEISAVVTYKSKGETRPFVISLEQQKRKGIASQLWPAAVFLSNFLEDSMPTHFSNPNDSYLIELGAGVGLCGLVCAALGFKKVFLTDLPVAMDLLNANILLNEQVIQSRFSEADDIGKVEACVLAWGQADDLENVMSRIPPGAQVYCIAADCVYWECLFQPLFDTVKSLVITHGVDIIIAHVKRWKKDEQFFKMCRKAMNVEVLVETIEMVPHEHTGVPTREIKRIYKISKKS